MARFWQRTKDRFTAPAQYIQTTDSVSRPMAVMLSLVMFFVAIALLVCLFFGGKWAYEQVTGKNDKPANPTAGTSSSSSTDSGSSSSNNGSGNTATVTNNGTGSAVVTERPQGTTSTGSSTTQSGNAGSTVPNTGTGSLLGVFVVSTAVGTLAYRAVLIRRLK